MNPYEILGVAEDADKKTIKKAYRQLAGQHHPDKGGDEDKFKEVAEAYSILSDDQKRQQYHARKTGRGNFGLEDLFGHGFNPFEEFFTPQRPRQRQVKKTTEDSDIQFNLRINLEQVKRGASHTVTYNRSKVCEDCHGEGGEGKRACILCDGTGVQVIRPNPYFVQQITCSSCRGRGTGFDKPCGACQTNGFVRFSEKVTIKIEEEKL